MGWRNISSNKTIGNDTLMFLLIRAEGYVKIKEKQEGYHAA